MANPVLKSATYSQTNAQFGAPEIFQWPTTTITAEQATPLLAQSAPIPCNVKILCVSAQAVGPTANTGLSINIASGANFGSFGSGTVTFGAAATNNGTATLTIAGPSPATSQVVSIAITTAEPVATAATAMAAAINAVPASGNPQVFAQASAGAVTLYQLQIGAIAAQQTYRCAITAPGMTFTPSAATAFSASTAAQGTPDNFATSTPSSKFAANGQFLFPSFQTVPVLTAATSVQTNIFPGITTGPGVGLGTTTSTAAYDIIFPMNRPLALVYQMAGFSTGSIALAVSALVMTVILDPNQPYPVAGMWTPNNSTIGCPSTA